MLKEILLLIFTLSLFPIVGLGQTLLLPSSPGYVTGTGACADIIIGAVSDHWRVSKKGHFYVRAVQQMKRHSDLDFTWSVNNGTILRGKGTWEIEVKPGKARTKGYVNATGFVDVELTVTSRKRDAECSLTVSRRVVVGKYGESETQAYDMTVTPAIVNTQKLSDESTNEKSILIAVNSVGIDPYNDPLTYHYFVDAGKIEGQGPNILWDLSGAPPGTYTITVGVKDSLCGVCKNKVTRVVEIVDRLPEK